MDKTYYKHAALFRNLRKMWRESGWQIKIRRASRERREETIQLTRQMGVITVVSRNRKAHG